MSTNTPLPAESEKNIPQNAPSTRRKVLVSLWTLVWGGWLIQLIKKGREKDSENFEIERKKKDKAMQEAYTYSLGEKPNWDDKEISKLITSRFKELYKLTHIPNLNLKWKKIDNFIMYLPASQFDGMNPISIWGYEILKDWTLKRIEYNDAEELRNKFNIQYWEK